MLPDALPGHQSVSDAAVRDRLGKLWGVQPPAEPGLSYEEMIGGGLRALYVMGANPAADSVTAEALGHLDFLVVQDLFLTETAQLADVVLPAVSFAEAEGTYTNLERRVQRGPQGISPVGESRADWQILAALAERWQTAQVAPQTLRGLGNRTGLRREDRRLEEEETEGQSRASVQALELPHHRDRA